MPNQFKVGDKVIVARMPVDTRFRNLVADAAYRNCLNNRTVLTIQDIRNSGWVGMGGVDMYLTDPEVQTGHFTCEDCLELESASVPGSVTQWAQAIAAKAGAIGTPMPSAPWVPQPQAVAQPVPYQEGQAVFITDDKPYRKGMPDSEKQLIESRLAVRRALRGY